MKSKLTFTQYYGQYLSKNNLLNLKKSYSTDRRLALRVNTTLISVQDFKKWAENNQIVLSDVPWCPSGYFYSSPVSLGCFEEFKLGYYYIQDAASMLPPEILSPQQRDRVLDLCSAPGGKTLHLSNLMNETGTVISNEVQDSRAFTLSKQLAKYGVYNAVLTVYDSSFFKRELENFFDRVLIDAPCSGEGMRDRGADIFHSFNYNIIRFNAKRQKRLLENGLCALKAGGTLVYSTCALSYDENEGVVQHILDEFSDFIEIAPITLKNCHAISNKDTRLQGVVRIMPYEYNTNGFFTASFRKIKKTNFSQRTSRLIPALSKNRKLWIRLGHKEELSILNQIAQIMALDTVKIPSRTFFVRFRNEVWLMPERIFTLPIPYIKYAGLKVGKYDKKDRFVLTVPAHARKIFK